MYKFVAYLLLCLVVMFLDFYYKLSGILTLTLDLIFSVFLIITFQDIKKNIKIVYNNYLLYGIVVIIFLAIFNEAVFRYFYNYPINYYNTINAFFIFSIIIKSFTEELIFRGYWLNKISEKYNPNISIFIISFGFALLHLFARKDPVFSFICSIILCSIFIKTHSILNSFMIHLLSNLFLTFALPNIILLYSNLESWSKMKSIVIVFLVVIYFFKLIYKKNDKSK